MNLLSNKIIIAAAGGIFLILIVAAISIYFFSSPKYPFQNILVTTGGSLRISGFDGFIIPVADEDKSNEYNLPITTKLASTDGWLKASQCIPDEGVYFTKNTETAMMLIFDSSDNIIGIYQPSNHQMPSPWVKTRGPKKADGTFIVDYEHYGIYVFLLDPTNACNSNNDYETVLVSNSTLPSYSIPFEASTAVSKGWVDPFFCSPGRGKYYQKDGTNHVLMYNANGNVIGIYQYVLNEMPTPWWKTKEIIGGGSLPIIDFEHYGFFIYFEDPMNACQSSDSKSVGTGGTHYAGPKAERSEYGPTPTPTVILSVEDTMIQLSKDMSSDSRTFLIDKEIELNSEKISSFISNLTDVQETNSKWINNVSHRGLSANVNPEGMKIIVDDVQSNDLKVGIWVDADSKVNLIEITGLITFKNTETGKLTISPK